MLLGCSIFAIISLLQITNTLYEQRQVRYSDACTGNMKTGINFGKKKRNAHLVKSVQTEIFMAKNLNWDINWDMQTSEKMGYKMGNNLGYKVGHKQRYKPVHNSGYRAVSK